MSRLRYVNRLADCFTSTSAFDMQPASLCFCVSAFRQITAGLELFQTHDRTRGRIPCGEIYYVLCWHLIKPHAQQAHEFFFVNLLSASVVEAGKGIGVVLGPSGHNAPIM